MPYCMPGGGRVSGVISGRSLIQSLSVYPTRPIGFGYFWANLTVDLGCNGMCGIGPPIQYVNDKVKR